MSINNTVAATPSMIALLAKAKARKAEAATTTAAGLRKQLEEAVGERHDVQRLELLRQEAKDAMENEELEAFEGELDVLIQLRKELEKTEAEAKRFASVSTEAGLQARLDQRVKLDLIEKELKEKSKAMYVKEAATKAAEAKIAQVLADLGDVTPGQRGAVMAFLRGNPQWNFIPTEGGRRSLLSAAGRAAAEFNKANKVKAKEVKAAKAAAAPLTQKLALK